MEKWRSVRDVGVSCNGGVSSRKKNKDEKPHAPAVSL